MGRNGQVFNAQSIGVEVGIDYKTVQSWIGILESSFIVYLLKPHHKNFSKTLIKRPKLYFYDTGIVCSLLGIRTKEHLLQHPLRGSIFESFLITELLKEQYNNGKPNNLYYWRDKTGHEIDIIIDEVTQLVPIEIKSGMTIHPDYFKHLNYWLKLSGEKKGYVLYQGNDIQKRTNGITVMPWREYLK